MNAVGRSVGVLVMALFIACGPSRGAAADPAKPQQKAYDTPDAAAQALISAAETYDIDALTGILGPDGTDLVITEDKVQDKNQAQAFAAQAREKYQVVMDPKNAKSGTLVVGKDGWPLPIPIVQNKNGQWRFDSVAGAHEVLLRRIGRNELDAIDICEGYVEAQLEYASEKRDGSKINQYARRVISTPGRQDGLAWRDSTGKWQGPVGEGIARVIAEGYSDRREPYHGYYFKILTGQGPAARFGAMNYLVGDAMIGGFAFVAAPADYGVTGIKTFIVNQEGVVYEKDLGEKTLEIFQKMTLFNPDNGWTPVPGT